MILDKKDFFNILSKVREYNGTLTYYKNNQKIDQLPDETMQMFLRAWLELQAKVNPIDYEGIRSAGGLCSSRSKLDEDIVAWVSSNNTETSRAVGFNFISGYWASGRNPSEQCLTYLVGEIDDKLPRESSSYEFALTALCLVADPVFGIRVSDEWQKKIQEKLLAHLEYLEEMNLHHDAAEMIRPLKDAGLRKFYAIFDAAKDMDTSQLNGKKLSDIVNALVSWLEIWSKPGWFDQEHMFYAGQYLGHTGRPEFEQAVCEWVSKDPTQERFAVAGTFLRGHWQMTDIKPTCSEFLQQAKTRFSDGTDAYEAIKLALTVAAEKTHGASKK